MTRSMSQRSLVVLAFLAGCATQRLSPDEASVETDLAKQTALDWLEQNGVLDRVDALDVLSVDFDDLGMAHVRFQQRERGILVSGGQVVVHLDPAGEVATTTDALLRDLAVDTVPGIDARIAPDRVHARGTLSSTDLQVLRHEGTEVLAWRLQFDDRGDDPSRDVVWVDAMTGDELLRYDNLQTARSRSTFTANNGAALPGTLRRAEGAPATGDQPVDWAHDNAGFTYDYYANEQGRDSWDGNGAAIVSTAHYSSNFDNAFWDGTQMVYGDGGFFFTPLSEALDVVGHELTHAVTERTAGLIYSGESGGLNEALSDIFGATIESFSRGWTVDARTWMIGELITRPVAGDALRFMDDPTRDGISIDNYADYTNGIDVHFSSGIANKAFFLTATDPALGIEDAADVWYRALVFYMTPSTTFPQAREAAVQAATDLFGAGSSQVAAVEAAWEEVGVASFEPFSEDPNLSAAVGGELRFQIQTPPGATALQFSTTGGTGDADLYVRFGSPASITQFTCKSEGPTTAESCIVNAPQSGTYHVLLSAFTTFSGVTLTVSSSGGSAGGVRTVGDLVAGDLVITEFLANPGVVADNVGEWIEVFNPGADDIDLDGLRIQNDVGNEGQVTGETVIAAGGYAVLGRRNAATFQPPEVAPDGFYGTAPLFANSGGDRVRVLGPTGTIDQTNRFQAVGARSGRARQLDPLLLDATSNDFASSWCGASEVGPGGDLGTPGDENSACP